MSTVIWVGSAPAVAQLNTWTIAGTWNAADTITVTIGSKSVTTTVGSTTIATIISTILAALQALSTTVYPEFAEVTWGSSSTTITATANTAGKPFTITIATNSALGTIDGAGTSTGTVTTASAGPQDWSTAANWSTGSVPVTGDTVYLSLEGGIIKYGLAQSAVTLTLLRIIAKSFTLGLPKTNSDGTSYAEYRPDYLEIGATNCYINTKSGRIKIDFGTVQTACQQDASGTGVEQNIPAVLLKGTHASNEFDVFGGQAGIAFFPQDSATALTLRVGGSATVTCGFGCTLDTVLNEGATLNINSAIATLLKHPAATTGTTTVYGTGAVNQITAEGGKIDYRTSGTLGAGGVTTLGGSAMLTFDNDQRSKTVASNFEVYGSATLMDSFAVCGAITIVIEHSPSVKLGLGASCSLLRTPI